MNKSAIKGFSVRARRKLIEDITQKAYALGIKDTKKYEEIEEFEGGFRIKNAVNQTVYPMSAKQDREKLIKEINRKGFEQVIEEVAYTWFNRIIAIRFMEVNEYLPIKVRILSSQTEGKTEPDVLTNIYDYIDDLDLDKKLVFELKENHKDEELFKQVFVSECNNLGKLMPQVFEVISDYTELLLPDQLLVSGSVIRDLVESIEEDDYKEEVEIIGWMYQYYISEKKDEVFAALKKNKKISKENIPAATQLFTPKWIVKYMTENSLGRLWQESHPNEDLKKKWEYYIEPVEQEEEVQKKINEIKNTSLSPEEIKILDPAMGSGHILVYAFDVLYDIYLTRGYAERDIPQLILGKNLYGLDIDDRAAQLASFALLMKARSKNRRFFRNSVDLHVCSIQESNGFSKEALEYLVNQNETQTEKSTYDSDVKYLVETFVDAKEYGSIVHINKIDFEAIQRKIEEIEVRDNLSIFEFGYKNEIMSMIPCLVDQAKIMTTKYDCVISNPPYMGIRKGMNPKLISYIENKFPDTKYDLFAVFMDKNMNLVKNNSFIAMITQHAWMFLSSYENFRESICDLKTVDSMIHLGTKAFEEIGGEVVQTTSFVFRNLRIEDYQGTYFRLTEYNSSFKKKENFLMRNSKFISKQERFVRIPGKVFGYWMSQNMERVFNNAKMLSEISVPKQGMATTDNKRFLRLWYEIKNQNIGYEIMSIEESVKSKKKWFPYNKGGEFRKWYGNNNYVVNWENDGREIKELATKKYKSYTRAITNISFFFKESITWSFISSGNFGVRYSTPGFIFDVGGSSIFPENDELNYLLAFMCSKLSTKYMSIYNPTLNFQVGNIANLPIMYTNDDEIRRKINELVIKNIELSKIDWDSYETSWDFKLHPLVNIANNNKNDIRISHLFNLWDDISRNRFNELKHNEEEVNKIFIELYNLGDEVDYKVENNEITLRISNIDNDVRSLISYFVGCVFGRYSMKKTGLINSGGSLELSLYSKLIPTANNILLVSEEDYFSDDVQYKFVEFVKVVFGEDKLEENLDYIAIALNPKSKCSSRQTIRNYFVKDFFKDHCKMYKKRPIYWMLDSGKQNGVKAIFYMHRYDKSTIARFRTDYLHEIQRYYENDIELTEKMSDKKRVDKLKKKLQEVTEFDKLVAHIAHQQIEFDLDDGVEDNYELFQGVEVPQGDGSTFKANLLAKRK